MMKKSTVLLLVVLFAVAAFSASGFVLNLRDKVNMYGEGREDVRESGKIVTEIRKVSSFDKIEASRSVKVFLISGDEEKVVVEADSNILDKVITKTDNSVLKCYIDKGFKRRKFKVKIYVYFKKLSKIKASSGAYIYGDSLIKTDNIYVCSYSSAKVRLNLDAATVSCKAGSSARINMEVNAVSVNCVVNSAAGAVFNGSADTFSGSANSSAGINAGDLVVKECDLSVSSAGNIVIKVTDKIRAKATSAGSIVYSGNPSVKDFKKNSAGNIRRR